MAEVSRTTGRLHSRLRTQWLALGAALVVLAGVLVAWALSQAADRVQVVQVARGVEAGDVIAAADLTVAGVAYDAAVEGLVPSGSLDALVGRVASIDLQTGALMQVGMWRDAPQLLPGEETVGALLHVGRFPVGLARGDVAIAASIDATADGAVGFTVEVRVIDAEAGADGELSVTIAVPAAQSIAVARLSATDQLVLVGRSTAASG